VITRTVTDTTSIAASDAVGSESKRFVLFTSSHCTQSACSVTALSGGDIQTRPKTGSSTDFTQNDSALVYSFPQPRTDCLDSTTGDVLLADAYVWTITYRLQAIDVKLVKGVETSSRMIGTASQTAKLTKKALDLNCAPASITNSDVVGLRAKGK
jgi:hypothetical protein